MSSQRSVEAATSEAALKLAVELYGQNVNVTGVRTVRSGGFLGFFTTERARAMIGDGSDRLTDTLLPALEVDLAVDPVDEVAALFQDPLPAQQVPARQVPASMAQQLYGRPSPTSLPVLPPACGDGGLLVDEPAVTAAVGASQSVFAAALARIQSEDRVVAAAVERSARTSTPPVVAVVDVAVVDVARPVIACESDTATEGPLVGFAGNHPQGAPANLAIPSTRTVPGGPADALHALGLPAMLVTPSLLASMIERGPHAAFTWLFRQRIASAPAAPNEAGQILLVLGPGEEALRGARQMAPLLGVDPKNILFTSARPDLAGRVMPSRRVHTVADAAARAASAKAGTHPVIVAVDAPLGQGNTLANQLIDAWDPDAVWAVVDATRRASDLTRWLDDFTMVDALIGYTLEGSTAPCELLSTGIPVALLDGRTATPKRWASLLCERLDGDEE
ncbi:hypothetical protein [Tessaracoccus sp.]